MFMYLATAAHHRQVYCKTCTGTQALPKDTQSTHDVIVRAAQTSSQPITRKHSTQSLDIVVIGAGIAGLATALALHKVRCCLAVLVHLLQTYVALGAYCAATSKSAL